MKIKKRVKIGLFFVSISIILILIFFLIKSGFFSNISFSESLKTNSQISQAKEGNSNNPSYNSENSNNQGNKTIKLSFIALSEEQRKKVEDALLSSDFIKDVPKKNPISIRFFYFDEGYRIWQDRFYLSNGELIEKTETSMELIIHSKYIDDLGTKDLCTIVQIANQNGDLGVETEFSDAELLWKYKGMMKHKDCFGF